YVFVNRAQLQNAADAGALAGAMGLINPNVSQPDEMDTAIVSDAHKAAAAYASMNLVGPAHPDVDPNPTNAPDGDVVIGSLAEPTNATSNLQFSDLKHFNAVQVRVSKTQQKNGQVPTFFARLFGIEGTSTSASATAVNSPMVRGFRASSGSS